MFDVGRVEYLTYSRLSEKSRMVYIKRFLKKNIELSEFDEFASGRGFLAESGNIITELIYIYGIVIPEQFTPRTRVDSEILRERDVQFNRTVKLKLLETWDVY